MRRMLVIPLLAVVAVPGEASAAEPDVVVVPVSFEVENVNHSALDCESDGEPYVIKGELVGPADVLARPPEDAVATLYLHEFSFGRFFWRFDAVPGYDFATAMARAGHTSVVIDRLGYDASGHPRGTATCLGAQADVTAQVVRSLKDGEYTIRGGGSPFAFPRIVLAGHSVGGGVAELAAHSFDDLGVAGLALLAWADQGYSARSVQQSLAQASDCSNGGEPAEPGGPPEYAYFGRTEADFQGNMFTDADPDVVATATSMRNRDPCGDNATLPRMFALNAASVGALEVPVLLLSGDRDPVFAPGAFDVQAGLYSSSPSVTTQSFDAAHALPLERVAPQVQEAVAAWLTEQDLVNARPPASPAHRSEATSAPARSPGAPPVADVQAKDDGRGGGGGVPRGEALPATGGSAFLPGALALGAAVLSRRGRCGRPARPRGAARRRRP